MPDAFAGSYSDFKVVRSRSVVQVVIELPLEQSEDFVAHFGLPRPGAEIPVALAKLAPAAASSGEAARREQTAATAAVDNPSSPKDSVRSERAREAYRMADDMERAVIRAARLCADPSFQEWIEAKAPDSWMSTDPKIRREETAETLRHILHIESRSEIGTDLKAYERFLALEYSFKERIGQTAERRG